MASYASVAELKARIDLDSAVDDAVLQAILDAATRVIDRFTNRLDGFEADASPSARYYTGNGRAYLLIDECIAITEVAVKNSVTADYDAWDSPTTNFADDGDWMAAAGDPSAPEFNALPYDLLLVNPAGSEAIFTSGRWVGLRGFRPRRRTERGYPTVRVTARWGYAEDVPDDIREACAMQSARWYKRFQGSMSDALASGELGQMLFLKDLDPDIATILKRGRYIKPATGRR